MATEHPLKKRPSDATLLKHLVPRIKELKAAGYSISILKVNVSLGDYKEMVTTLQQKS